MSIDITEYNIDSRPTWCAGCGNFVIHASLKKALSELNIKPSEVFMSFDIGCNGNGADKINVYRFKGLHGRSIPLAVGAHLANRRFTVLADIGDGGCFHEGLDHIVHAIRSNYNITILIHNNQSFALTTGQATLTTNKDKAMYAFPSGRTERDFNISEFILNLTPSFYAKAYSGDPVQLSETMKEAIINKGCSIIEIMQLCPTYNKEFTSEWANQHIKKVADIEAYNSTSLEDARKLVLDNTNMYVGTIYKNEKLQTFYDSVESRKASVTELVDEVKPYDVTNLLNKFE